MYDLKIEIQCQRQTEIAKYWNIPQKHEMFDAAYS